MIGDYCYRTGKARLTESTAKAILDSNIYHTEEGHPRTYYWCLDCESFHLTSQTGSRYYRKKRRKERYKHILTGD